MRLFVLDDANYVAKVPSGEAVINQSNMIKSIADQSETLHLLASTYDILPIRNLNGQLGRISLTVHFKRYKYNEEDIELFIKTLKSLLGHLPLPDTPDLANQWKYFYERCLGCIGVLKDWFTRALSEALEGIGRQSLLNYLIKIGLVRLSVCR